MATLRDNLFARPTVSTTELDRPYIEGMSSLRRGWEAGRIGTEANSLGAEWASANASGDAARAASLREQADALQARRNIYSPEVNRVEDVKGVDSLMGYVGGQVGQGAASMVDPVLASTGVAAVGTGLRFSSNPIAKAVGAGLQTLGAPAAAYAINQNQLKGEFANDAYQDKELMARTSAKDFNDTASMYGYAAGALDTVLPAMVGRTLGGAGLRMGAKEAAGTFGGRLVRNMGLEGVTELGQDVGSKATQGYLNPNRDTSEDASSYLNSFVGGAAGSGPLAAAEALGASGTQRVNGVAGAVKDTAGSVVDMARPYAEAGMDKAGKVAGKVRDKVIDLATGEDGTQSVTALKDNLKAASQELKSKWQATQEERDLIMGNPPAELQGSQDPNAWQLWQEQNEPKRMQAIVDRLDAMGQSGDQTAVDLVGRIMSDDPVAQQTAVEEAADYIVGQSEIAQLEKQAGRFGEAASKGGKLIGKAAMWAARKGFDAAKGFGQAVWDGAKEGSKKNAQAAGNADRMAEYLSAASQRKGPIAELMRDMGYEIAEMADLAEVNPSTAAPDLRRNLNNSTFSLGVNRIVNSLRVAYGAQAEQVVGNLRQMAAPSAAPVFDAMAQELTAQRADKSGAHTAQIRSTAAAELMGAVDAETETKLLKEGINLRAPESQRQLLGMVEAVSLGRAAPQARKALEKLVGRDTLNRMLSVVAPQTEQDSDESYVNDGEVMEEGFTVDEDGEVVENSSSAYDQEAALKTFAKGEGSKVYGFFGTGNRTDLDSRDPFAADVKGMTREQYKQFQQENINRQAMGEDPLPDPRRRPRLFTKGQTLSEKAGGGIAIDKRVADLEKYLQVDRTPERMAALMEQEGNKAGAEKVRALMTRGDESAQATLDSAMKSFFVNRAGGWRVGAKPAWDVLQGQNAQPTKVLSLYRDYLRQDGDTERAELANQVLLDEMDQSKGSRANFRVQAGARKKVKADAEAYFRERELAVAERLSDRDNMKLDETELLSLHDSGFKVVNRARSLEGQGNKQIAAANILTFKSALSPNGGLLHVKVSDLVRLVQQRRNERTANDFEDTSGYFGNGNKNRAYLDLVLEGVGMIMDTGRVEGWPYKLNEKNGKEYFGEGKNGVPDSLMLVTTTNGGMLYGKEQNAAGKAGEKIAPIAGPRDPRSIEDARTDEYQEKVARDQNDRADFFSPDSRQEQEPSGYKLSTKAPRGKQIHLPTVAVFDDLDSKRGLQRNAGFQGLQTANRTDVKPHEAKTTDLKMTPLDVATKPKGGRAVTGAPDDFADQRARSISQGYTADSGTKQGQTYPKAKMESRGTALGQQLGQLLSADFDAGMAEVDQWLRMAQAPTYAKKGATGGAHLAMPVAVALSADNLGMVDAGPKDHERLQAARAQVLRIVADSDLAQKDKLKVAKAIVAADVREKLTVMNLDKFLDKNAAPAKEAGAPVGKSQSAPSGESERVIPSRIGATARNFFDLHIDPEPALRAAIGSHQLLFSGAMAAWNAGMSMKEYLSGPGASRELARLVSAKLSGVRGAQALIDHTLTSIEQIYGSPRDAELEAAISSRLAAGRVKGDPLASYMDEFAASDLPAGHKAVAKAVKKVASGTRVVQATDKGPGGADGWFVPHRNTIYIHNDSSPSASGKAQTVLHEGVHAATVAAVEADPELNAAIYALMAHAVKHDPAIGSAYGLTNSLEFLAEGLSNVELQRRLYKIPASSAVEKYLGRTLANAWEGFVQLMRKALKLPDHHTSALVQTVELGGRAMKMTSSTGSAVNKSEIFNRPMVPINIAERSFQTVLRSGRLDASGETEIQTTLGQLPKYAADGKVPHWIALLGETLNVMAGMVPPGSMDGAMIQSTLADIRDSLGARLLPSKRNDQPGSAPKSTQAERDAAMAYVKKALGNKVKVEFADITGYSGEFIDADDLIRISTTPAAGTLQTAYHETLHAFFKQFVRSNPLAMDVIKALAEHKPTLERVHALLDGYPEAQAALANGEERLAYMYQFWAADLLDLPYGKPRTLFQKLLKFFRRVLGQVSDLERSADLLTALHTGQLGGDPSVAGKVVAKALNQGTWTKKQLRKMDGLVQMIAAGVLPANDVLRNSDSMTSKKLGVTFWTNPGEGSDGSAQEGYLNARHRLAARYVNEFSLFISDLNDRDLKAMTTALQAENDDLDSIAHAPTREAAKRTRALIQRFRKYMVEEKGLQLGDRGPNYFPRVWDTEALMANQTEFLTLLTTKYGSMLHGNNDQEKQKSAMRLFNALITNNMVDGKMPAQREDGVLTPFFAQGQGRDMAWLDGADIAKFQSKDAIKTLTTYFHAGARAAEYAARFGQKGEKLSAALNNVEIELMEAAGKRERRGEFKDTEARNKWVARQMRDVNQAVEAMEGSIGQNSEGTAMRKFGSAVTVYQNVRLLPLAIFSQVVDPLGMLARGATMKQAYESFLRGMKEVGQSWADMFREVPKERRPDQWEKLAMAVGSVDAAMFSHHVSEEYSSTYMSPTARKINDKFFRLNGMEAWNRGIRVGATKAAVQFLEHHKRTPSEHSVRWLKELGLAPKDLIVDSDGALLTDWRSIKTATGMNEEQARAHTDRIHYAINHWVQGAVLTPNAAQRPAWSSDPSYSMFFHLKQFSYSFHKTILHRAVKELEYGNLAPLGSFAWYIPAMIAADVTKGLMLNGGELPQHLKGMDLGEWVMHGIDRSGALGIGNIGVDATGDLASMGGPAVEQIIDGFRDDMGATTLNALPAHGLFKALVN